MGRDKRYSSEEKLFWLKRILSNEISLFQASKISGIRRSTLSDWKRLYEITSTPLRMKFSDPQ